MTTWPLSFSFFAISFIAPAITTKAPGNAAKTEINLLNLQTL